VENIKQVPTSTITIISKQLLFLFLVFAGAYYAKPFLVPILIGGILATLLLPLCNALQLRKLPKALSVLICMLVLLFSIAIIISLLGWKVAELANDFTLLKQKIIEIFIQLQTYIFNQFGISIAQQSFIINAEQPSYSHLAQQIANFIASLFASFSIIFTYVFLLLYYKDHIKIFIIKLAKSMQKNETEIEIIVSSATRVSKFYLVGLFKMIFCLWIMYGIAFSILGVKNAIFFAILCGLLEIIPYVGNIVGTLLTILITAIHGAPVPILLGIALTYGIIQLIQGWILEPLILGPQVKINPLFTIIALIIGQLIWGIPGIVLAIPIIAIIKIICDHFEPLMPFGFLIGETQQPRPKYFANKKNLVTTIFSKQKNNATK
jgi:predicted PurR-regulated permease PerM